jgi:hypothetical protein
MIPMKKLILKDQDFLIQPIPLEESPDRVTIRHKSTHFSSTADTRAQAWAALLEKLSNHYGMKIVLR